MTEEQDERQAADPPAGFRPYHSSSPYTEISGPFFQRELADGAFVRGFRVLQHHTNAAGYVHGGLLMTFVDTVMGQAVGRAIEGPALTIRMSTNFLQPARLGQWVEGRGRVVRTTREIIFVTGDVTVGRHTVLAAEGMFQRIRSVRR